MERTMNKTIQILLGFLCFLFVVVTFSVTYSQSQEVRTVWQGDHYNIASNSNSYVITHLIGYTNEGEVVAALPQPIITLDSWGPAIPYKAMQALHWTDPLGHPATCPSPGSKMRVAYYRPSYSRFVVH